VTASRSGAIEEVTVVMGKGVPKGAPSRLGLLDAIVEFLGLRAASRHAAEPGDADPGA
jgi:hypothetical protein